MLSRESEVTVLVAPLALERGLSPHDGELREALVRVDERIADALMSCLAVDQAARPAPETMRDELDGFGERYVEDVRHALAGEPLTPVASAVQTRRQGARRAARVIAWVVCPGAAVGVAGLSAWLADGGGTGGPWVPAALLASPTALAALVRVATRRSRHRLAYGSATLLATALVCGGTPWTLIDNVPARRVLLAGLLVCASVT
ncbi:hypothetical protein [Thermophilibacter sp.]|uniref:hypothetical protein n=1 Tax=Thermophilibacter sp. TaxID=2847309 RepID=UPI003A95A452